MYEDYFNRLASYGLGKVSNVKSKNKKIVLRYEKMTLVEIASNPLALDKFPNKIKFEQYESGIMN